MSHVVTSRGEISLVCKQKDHELKLFGAYIFWWGGGLPIKRVGPKGSVCPSTSRGRLLVGYPVIFTGISPGSPEKVSVQSLVKSQEKGVLAKRVSVESSVTGKETKSTQGYWAQQYIWH